MRTSGHLSIAVGVIITLVGIVGVVLASLGLDGQWETAIVTVLSVVLSIGLISLVYEMWLRSVVMNELLALVGLKESIERSALREIVLPSHVPWARILDGDTFVLLPLDIPTFASRDWQHVLDSGRSRKINVSVLLPSQSAMRFGVLEAHIGAAEGSLAQMVENGRETMVKGWESAANSQQALRPGSTLRVYEYDAFPANGVFATESTIAIELTATVGREHGDQGCVLIFDARRNSPFASWALEQAHRALSDERMVDFKEVP